MMQRLRTFAQSTANVRTWPLLVDLAVFAGVVGIFYALSFVGHYWFAAAVPEAYISRSPRALPMYAFYSLVRMGVAYTCSLLFALAYGYIAAYNKRAEVMMIAVLDVLQSIPVLSFLPGVMLATIAIVPGRQLGLELGSILLIFTAQVWNMAFSFYSSLKAIPRELREASSIYRFSRWQRFFQLELPFSAIGLVWNSMVSVAGGWFTLMLCEMFVFHNHDFRLPGLGSYLKTAADNNDSRAMVWGIVALIAVIVALDQVVWRPLIAWSDKFKFEQTEAAVAPRSPMIKLILDATLLRVLRHRVTEPLEEKLVRHFANHPVDRPEPVRSARLKRVQPIVVLTLIGAVVIYATVRTAMALASLPAPVYTYTFHAAAATLLRVIVSLVLAVAWCVPAGVAIGFNPRLARIAQPLAQVAASVPATALFPVILLLIIRAGGGVNTAAIVIMLLGTQWYILFNVIAGALAIPSDMRDVATVFRFNRRERWATVILPGIFPYLVTGLVTASGGAWNASIVAEYMKLGAQTYSTVGLGAQVSAASNDSNGQILLLSTIVMAAMVVGINRLLWKPLFRLAETRYRLDV
ncbi:MAG: ABC transporter permease subunit [Acidobacteriota bacterium]|nr:ABC transporter permease subunit [Acidobacteriota bacterium]